MYDYSILRLNPIYPMRIRSLVFFLLVGIAPLNSVFSSEEELLLHVPSPDWRDQVIYFLMIDRFEDGDPSINDQGVGVYDPTKDSHYQGGDLQGIINRLDYIQNLGATAVWATPHIANMWWDPLYQFSGYHGYWARDFKAVDEHYGTLETFKKLSDGLHRRGMYLIQDVVVNHTGNFFYYDGEYDPENPLKNFKLNEGTVPSAAPTQHPFNLNDANNPEHFEAAIFNWTPEILDFTDPHQEVKYQTAGLDDLNTANPVVRDVLKDSFGYWIRETGVDAFRVDTAKYVEVEFYESFLWDEDGIYATAQKTGRDDFLVFGEVFQSSDPLSDKGEKKLALYTTTEDRKLMNSAIGFPLYKEISRVFAGAAPTSWMTYRLEAQMKNFRDPFIVPNFIDNHDVERFLATGSLDAFKQAYILMMTVPGIPMIYQGNEQLFHETRRAMFAEGMNGEENSFIETSEMFKFIQMLANLRTSNHVFTRGKYESVAGNDNGAGLLVYKRLKGDEFAYVVFNTADSDVLVNRLQTNMGSGNSYDLSVSLNSEEGLAFDEAGYATGILPARAALVYKGTMTEKTMPQPRDRQVKIDKIEDEYVNMKSAKISGTTSKPNAKLYKVIDGQFGGAETFYSDESGKWEATLDVADLGEHKHTVEIYWKSQNEASERYVYKTKSDVIGASSSVSDPSGDDYGPTGNYTQPQHNSYGMTMDLLGVEAISGGSIMKLRIKMAEISAVWVPPHNFDHLNLGIYMDHPDHEGISVLPLINSVFPDGGAWDFGHSVAGWSNYMFGTENAGAKTEGTKLGVAPLISVDADEGVIELTYSGRDFGVNDWAGTKIYITTWDKTGEGALRALGPEPALWNFGGAEPDDAKTLDDLLLVLE
jgi:glycosidase